jgi:hypothetical protein
VSGVRRGGAAAGDIEIKARHDGTVAAAGLGRPGTAGVARNTRLLRTPSAAPHKQSSQQVNPGGVGAPRRFPGSLSRVKDGGETPASAPSASFKKLVPAGSSTPASGRPLGLLSRRHLGTAKPLINGLHPASIASPGNATDPPTVSTAVVSGAQLPLPYSTDVAGTRCDPSRPLFLLHAARAADNGPWGRGARD